jgi:hypothetical protein
MEAYKFQKKEELKDKQKIGIEMSLSAKVF